MKMLVSRVDVGKQNITVTGPKAALAVALKEGNSSKERVPSFVRDWCTNFGQNWELPYLDKAGNPTHQTGQGMDTKNNLINTDTIHSASYQNLVRLSVVQKINCS